ncbi:TPM domain-containing protein, partial [Anaerosalibacter bizertensis]|nr:TPM domain-containing protein [Anaerosalibacter bizertensis]
KWGIGSREYDNGVLILVSPKDRELWIEIGYGLEGVLPDGKVGRIRDEQIFPYFKEGNYSEGVLRGFNSILNAIEEEYNIDLEREEINESYYYDYNEEDQSSGEFGIF